MGSSRRVQAAVFSFIAGVMPRMAERIKLGIFLFIVMTPQVRRCRPLTAGTQRVPECALMGLCNAPLGGNRR